MAELLDSFQATEGQGTPIATDVLTQTDSVAREAQVMKLLLGPKGIAQILLAAGQALMANSVPVVLASNQSVVPVSDTSGTLLAGQKTGIGTSGVAVVVSPTPCREVAVQSDPTNSAALFIGNASGQYWRLAVGEAVGVPVNDVALVYVKAASGSTSILNYLGRV